MGPIEQLSYILPTCSALVDGIQVTQMNNPTPCDRFTVQDVLDHMMGPASMFACMFRGEQPPETGSDRAYEGVPSKEFRDVMDDLLGSVKSPDALLRTIESPFGTMDGETFARLVAFDGLVHSWDLATATGQHLALPSEVVDAVASFAHLALTDDMRDGEAFKQPTDPGLSAGAIEQLAAFSGRTVSAG